MANESICVNHFSLCSNTEMHLYMYCTVCLDVISLKRIASCDLYKSYDDEVLNYITMPVHSMPAHRVVAALMVLSDYHVWIFPDEDDNHQWTSDG